MGVLEKMNSQKLPKKLLALDGGGIRGMVTVAVLATIENLMRAELGQGKNLRLCE